jgi:hypothetical protein
MNVDIKEEWRGTWTLWKAYFCYILLTILSMYMTGSLEHVNDDFD